jgi:hypothetical protein
VVSDVTTGKHSAGSRGKNHSYVGHAIPWFVRLLWLGFWIICITYILTWLVPALKKEIVSPP